jgi:hypothetical protein
MPTRCILVVIASEHNVAEAQSALALQPIHVVIIASRHQQVKARAQRLAAWIAHNQAGTTASVRCESMQGDDYGDTVRHLQAELTPELDRLLLEHPGAQVWLNVTGGTKSTVIAVLRHRLWHTVVYKPLTNARLQQIEGPGAETDLPSLPTLKPLQHLSLYAEIKLAEPEGSLPSPTQMQAACALWMATISAESPWHKLADHPVGRSFFAGEDPAGLETVQIPWDELPGLQSWWQEHLLELLPQETGYLRLPFEDRSLSKAVREATKKHNRWLRGTWLEDAAVAWLLEAGIQPNQIEAGRRIQPLRTEQGTGSANEFDVVFAHKDRLWVIECKYKVDKDKVQDYANQLGNQMALVGRPNAALLLANEPSDALRAAAGTRGFRVLFGPEDLAGWIGVR